jgi:putative glutamine amidotransferase
MRRPLIGITGPNAGGLAAWWFTALAVRRCGGTPRRIRPDRGCDIELLDGLIIGGGADVAPELYGQERDLSLADLEDSGLEGWRRLIGIVLFPLLFFIRRVLTTKLSGLDPARDALENRLLAEALATGMPVLGICRGMQLINVACGGSLHQRLDSLYEERPSIRSVLPRKSICITEHSRLHALLGRKRLRVNALHDQAIDRKGTALSVAAVEDSGVVQAIEREDGPWVLGVQWHPEYLPQRPEQRALFAALVAAALNYAARCEPR